MLPTKAIGRREFVIAVMTSGSIAGCLGTQGDQPGVIDSSDLSIQSPESSEVTATTVKKDDNNRGLEISTNDSITDGKVIAEIPTSIPHVSKSTVYINADVNKIDDDTEAEIRFPLVKLGYRSVYIGNEYKNKNNGVLATETGSGYELLKPFQKLPSSKEVQTDQIQGLDRIQFVIRDGDFQGTIWDLGFMFEDKTIGIL